MRALLCVLLIAPATARAQSFDLSGEAGFDLPYSPFCRTRHCPNHPLVALRVGVPATNWLSAGVRLQAVSKWPGLAGSFQLIGVRAGLRHVKLGVEARLTNWFNATRLAPLTAPGGERVVLHEFHESATDLSLAAVLSLSL